MAKKRLRKNKQQGMRRRLSSGKKPMPPQEKEARKKRIEAQREENKLRLAKLLKKN
ncbi:MAG: hypothetical protein Q8Q04_00665 [archaeon]|nr:hypothetical protein [archaeon]